MDPLKRREGGGEEYHLLCILNDTEINSIHVLHILLGGDIYLDK